MHVVICKLVFPHLHTSKMAPDLNSLPPSRSMSSSPMQSRALPPSTSSVDHQYTRRDTPSPRSSSVSLAAAATINATEISRRNSNSNRGSPRTGRVSERRRSAVAMNLNLNDPALPAPGELASNDHRHSYMAASPSSIGGSSVIATGDPHHHRRNPSLGEIHQELEQEQEAQVNRLLMMIRTQQVQLEQMQRYQQDHNLRQSSQPPSATVSMTSNNHISTNSSTAVIDDSTPTSERSLSFPSMIPLPSSQPLPRPMRRQSRDLSTSNSPALRPFHGQEVSHGSSGEWPPSPIEIVRQNSSRDESAYYQAETATLTRENQMLRLRIRELERQINDLNSSQANTPVVPSNLATSPPVSSPAIATRSTSGTEVDKE